MSFLQVATNNNPDRALHASTSRRSKTNECRFYRSNGNAFDLVDRNEGFAKARAINVAEKLARILGADSFQLVSSRTLHICGNDYQASTFVFTNQAGQSCAPEISVPLDFAGDVRIWTNNRWGKRVWTTVEKLEVTQLGFELFLNS